MLNAHLLIPLFCLLFGLYLMWHIPSFTRPLPPRNDDHVQQPRITIIIPARNEEHRIPSLLISLQKQTLSPHQLIVVNDGSSDETASLAEKMGAQVIEASPLPPGWTGKSWACWQGAQRATGRLLLFLDADTWLEPDGLAKIARVYGEKEGLLTIQPYHVTCRPYEELSAFFNILLMAGLNAFTPLGDSIPPSGSFGACAMCSLEHYRRTGGHRVAGENVLESIPLARSFLEHDLPVRCYGGSGAVSFRMYPGGFRDLVEGWSKGFGSGALAIRRPFLLMSVGWIVGCFAAFFTLLRSFGQPSLLPLLPALLYCLYALYVWWTLRRIGSFRWWTAILFPIPLCFFALVMLRSFVSIHLLGQVTWRGRAVRTRNNKPIP